jgi:hypothetical protein
MLRTDGIFMFAIITDQNSTYFLTKHLVFDLFAFIVVPRMIRYLQWLLLVR